MKLLDLLTTPGGMAIDRGLVRWTGRSLLMREFAKAAKMPSVPTTLLLVTIGAKTGELRKSVLPYYRDGKNVIIVGSNGGAPRNPYWVGNLAKNPQAWVWIDRRRYPATARISAGEERERLWQSITKGKGPYAAYQKRAHPREIPFVVLEHGSDGFPPARPGREN